MEGGQGAPDGELHGLVVASGALFLVGLALIHQLDDLGEAHGADDEGGKGNAAHEVHAVEVEAGDTGEGVHADGGHQDAKHGDDHALGGVLADEPADGGHGDEEDQGHLGVAEVEADLGQAGGGDGEDDDADGAADEGG